MLKRLPNQTGFLLHVLLLSTYCPSDFVFFYISAGSVFLLQILAISHVVTSCFRTAQVKEDWKFVAMVMDRLFLWIFTVAVLGESPTLA
jgi:hypothetical protein